MSIVTELEGLLQAMAAGKAPGVSGKQVSAVNSLCENNVQVTLTANTL
jgi:hypothetical protein